jgi:hypothetical protein
VVATYSISLEKGVSSSSSSSLFLRLDMRSLGESQICVTTYSSGLSFSKAVGSSGGTRGDKGLGPASDPQGAVVGTEGGILALSQSVKERN